MVAKIRHLMTGSLERHSQLRFQLKPAMISSYANTYHFPSKLSEPCNR
jgi:hypothetical protein